MKHIHKIIITFLSLIVAVFIGWIVFDIGDYYLTDPINRPHHLDHKFWKPGGTMGHGLGILGGSMMVIMFIYSIRKRVKIVIQRNLSFSLIIHRQIVILAID